MNTINQQKIIAVGLLAASLPFAGAAIAEDSGFTITPSASYIDFDSDRDLDETEFFSIGLGYKFDNPWQLELVYGEGDTELDGGSADVDFETLHLDALYHLSGGETVTPYAVFGAGHVESDVDGADTKESNLNVGAGLKIALGDVFSLRPDLRVVRDFDDENLDFVASLGLQAMLGGKASAAAPVTAVDGDADGDGVSDSNDRCPSTPRGVEVDANGCALDSDGDGVPNHADNCPDSEAGARVDANGCYIVLKEAREIELKVNFASNSDVVPSDYYSEISALADFLREYPATNVVIEGHTDSSGQAAYNQNLSERRAKNVAAVLVDSFKVGASRVSAVGYGEERPIADNATAAGKAANRRVVAVVATVVEKRAE